ncbi:MAG: glutamine-hydrolyzing carbamoyl-phosphate synthase small subunit [Candidatus Omnitrophica bacterium]|nr:glutamine-hydrolyzing carbamoyl-phosphate synthase small subunit [Candidatus Omnitrophota bacterium]
MSRRALFPGRVPYLFTYYYARFCSVKNAALVFEDGRVFRGRAFGAVKEEACGEVVFNTSLSGYQEILTDPSYKGQIVTMTYPLIGNYGVNDEDLESSGPRAESFIIRELNEIPSNYRSQMSFQGYLEKNGIMGITDVDTRAVTKHIREKGALKAIISTTGKDTDGIASRAASLPGTGGQDLVKEVSPGEVTSWNDNGDIRVAVLDCGVKYSILRHLERRGCAVTCFPANVSARELMKIDPHGILLSNGPGDPQGAPYVAETIRDLLGKVPVFGICLGHQMLGLALGGNTYKLKFGHHGANHPVMDVRTGKVAITAQNHNFCVDHDSLQDKGVEITHLNLNDQTVEGMQSEKMKFFSVQFHPEAGPGPNDAVYLFDRFLDNIRENK